MHFDLRLQPPVPSCPFHDFQLCVPPLHRLVERDEHVEIRGSRGMTDDRLRSLFKPSTTSLETLQMCLSGHEDCDRST